MTLYPPNEKNRQSPKKIKYTTWDIETDYPNNPKKVLLIGFFDGEKYRYWSYERYGDNCMKQFLLAVLDKKYYGYAHYAHFGGKFDFIYMLEELKKLDREFEIIDVNGRILSIEINVDRTKGRFWKFNDSFAIMPKKLHEITHSFDVPHKKIEKNFFEILEPNYVDKFDNWEMFKEYLEYDCKGLYEAIGYFENIVNTYNGEIKLTIASTAMDTFKHAYLKTIINSLEDVKIGKNIENEDLFLKTEDLVRSYYFGGRCEIFTRYIEYGYYYDVNSLYPFVMLQPMPVSKPIFALPENINFKNDTGFIYCSSIDFMNTEKIPLIPYKLSIRANKKLIYPMGHWQGWLDLDMYRKALTLGYEFKIDHGIIFNTETIFKDYIEDFYKLRFTNDAMKLIAKLMMNSLYGKFAQKRLKKQIIKYLGIDEETLKELIPYNIEMNLYEKESISTSKHIIPSIAAHITTLAQLELYKYFEKCNNDIYYCDTDSFITKTRLPSSKNLGDIKLEYEIDKAVFLLPKTYYLNGFDTGKQEHVEKITMKGFMKNKFTFDDFYNAMVTNNFEIFNYKMDKLWGFKESIKRNKTFLTYDTKINSLKTGYDKRVVANDGILTTPLIIDNGIVMNRSK
jgi:hypothetical protein